MSYISLHVSAGLGLGILALVAGCASNDGAPTGGSTEDLAASRIRFESSTLGPARDLRLASGLGDVLLAAYADEDGLNVARSDDRGAHWTTQSTLSTLPGAGRSANIVVAASDPNVLYLTRRGFYSWGMGPVPEDLDHPGGLFMQSTDGGRTWVDRTAMLPAVPQGRGFDTLDVNPTDPSHLVAANCDGVQKSLDGGATWRVVPGSKLTDVDCNSADLYRGIDDRKTIYVLSDVGEGGGSALLRTYDDGVTWQRADMTVDGGAGYLVGIRGLVVHPDDARHVYLSDLQSFYSSDRGGDRFFRHGTGIGEAPSNVAVDPASGKLYAAKDDGLFNWVPTSEPENGHWERVSLVPGGHLGDPMIRGGRLYVTNGTQLLIAPLP